MNALPPSSARKIVAAESFADLFTPKLVTVFREGYGAEGFPLGSRRRTDRGHRRPAAVDGHRHRLGRDAAAPGCTPPIVGGIAVSALGGSRFQIGGPAGAFIVLVAGTQREIRH